MRSQIDVVTGGVELGGEEETTAGYSFASLLRAPQVCSVHERHTRRPGWTDLFFDLVFVFAITQIMQNAGATILIILVESPSEPYSRRKVERALRKLVAAGVRSRG